MITEYIIKNIFLVTRNETSKKIIKIKYTKKTVHRCKCFPFKIIDRSYSTGGQYQNAKFPPHYSNATISAPPTTTTSSSDPKENGEVKPPAANSCPLVTATGAGSKIIHPPEDVSLEEIRARNIKYRPKPKPDAPVPQPQPAPAMITPSTSQAEVWVSCFLYLFSFSCRIHTCFKYCCRIAPF